MASLEQNCAENPPPTSATVEMQQLENDEDEAITLKSLAREMKTMEMRLKLHENQLFANFCEQLTVMEERLFKNIEFELELINDSGSILENRLATMNEDIFKRDILKHEISNLKNELEALKMQATEHKKARQRIAKEATIYGIDGDIQNPKDLESVFVKVCEYIDYEPPQLKEIFRDKPKDGEDEHPEVIAKFLTPRDRNRTIEAFKKYKNNKGGISMRAVGFDSDSYFRIYESLTIKNRMILDYAISRKLQNHLHEAYSYKGSVYVCLKKNSPPIQLLSKNHLKNIIVI